MPKISGLGLGDIKKISGLGIGNFKKVSGLGLGHIWQDAVQVGMYKNGNFDATTTQQSIPSWIAEDVNSTVSGNALVIPSAGNWILEANIVVSGTGFGSGTWFQGWIYKGATASVTGSQIEYARPSTGNNYFLSSITPVACAQDDLITVHCDAELLNAYDVIGETGCYVRAMPV